MTKHNENLMYCDHGLEASGGVEHFGYPEYDARGIYLTTVCDKCRDVKLSPYRREVLEDPEYECDEPIEEDY